MIGRAAPLLVIALAACAPGRGAGVYPETARQREQRQNAEYLEGEKLGLTGVRAKLIALGVRPGEFAEVVESDYDLRVIELRVGPERLAQLDARALARLALDSNYRLTFPDPRVARAVPVAEEGDRRDVAREIAVLKRRGDWDRVPRRRFGETLSNLAYRIEHWCDYDPGAALRVIDQHWLEYRTQTVDRAAREPTPGRDTARFLCLRRTVYAGRLRGRFIGYRGKPAPPEY